ncbi:hypothetical protein LQZ18_03775 [Lachnospiraceae bacterium ZAX-1]
MTHGEQRELKRQLNSIPTLAGEYGEIIGTGKGEEHIVEIEKVYKRKPKIKAVHK